MKKGWLKNKHKENKVFFHPLLWPFRELQVDSSKEIANMPTGVKTPYTKCTDGSAVENMEFSERGSLHLLHSLWRSRSKQRPSFPIISLLQPCTWSDTSCSMITENMREAGNWAHSMYGPDVLVEWKKAPWKPSCCAFRENTRQNLGAGAFPCSSTPPPDRKAALLPHFLSLTSFCLKQIFLRQLIRSTAKKNSRRRLASSTFLDIPSVHCLMCTS